MGDQPGSGPSKIWSAFEQAKELTRKLEAACFAGPPDGPAALTRIIAACDAFSAGTSNDTLESGALEASDEIVGGVKRAAQALREFQRHVPGALPSVYWTVEVRHIALHLDLLTAIAWQATELSETPETKKKGNALLARPESAPESAMRLFTWADCQDAARTRAARLAWLVKEFPKFHRTRKKNGTCRLKPGARYELLLKSLEDVGHFWYLFIEALEPGPTLDPDAPDPERSYSGYGFLMDARGAVSFGGQPVLKFEAGMQPWSLFCFLLEAPKPFDTHKALLAALQATESTLWRSALDSNVGRAYHAVREKLKQAGLEKKLHHRSGMYGLIA